MGRPYSSGSEQTVCTCRSSINRVRQCSLESLLFTSDEKSEETSDYGVSIGMMDRHIDRSAYGNVDNVRTWRKEGDVRRGIMDTLPGTPS